MKKKKLCSGKTSLEILTDECLPRCYCQNERMADDKQEKIYKSIVDVTKRRGSPKEKKNGQMQ